VLESEIAPLYFYIASACSTKEGENIP
jgi:hypothetical protein